MMRAPHPRALMAALSLALFLPGTGRAAPEPAPIPKDAGKDTHEMEAIARFLVEGEAKARAARKKNTGVVRGEGDWLYFGPELASIARGPFWGEHATRKKDDPLGPIVDFHRQLEREGIRLVFVPIPTKPVIYPEHVGLELPPGTDFPRLDPQDVAFVELLKKEGLDVLDPWSLFVEVKDEQQGFCRQDTHPAGITFVRLAERMAAHLEGSDWLADARKNRVSTRVEWKDVTLTGDLYRALGDASMEREVMPLRFVYDAEAGGGAGPEDEPLPVPDDPSSPVLLLGDSNALVFHVGGQLHATGAGLADQLVHALGFPIDVIGVLGAGATASRVNLMRRVRTQPGYLGKKKVVFWVLNVRELTDKNVWAKVPLRRPR